jgi:hypothetical protein
MIVKLRPPVWSAARAAVLAAAAVFALVAPSDAQAQKRAAPPSGTASPPAVKSQPAGVGKLHHRDYGSFQRPIPNSAWAALGFDQRPLKVGDAWRYAWSMRKKRSILMRSIRPEEHASPQWGAPVIIDYRVTKVTRQTIAGRTRQNAVITAIYASSVTDALQTGNELAVDHYFNPVQRCVYTRWLLYGQCAELDTRSPIRSMGAKPFFIGDLENTPAQRVPSAPTAKLVKPLQDQVSKMVGGKAGFLSVPVQVGRRKFADTYWAPGNLVPSLVLAQDIQGLLIGQRLSR